MSLNIKQREALATHLETVANGPCQMCGTTDWQPDDEFLYLSEDPNKMGRFAIRVITVRCGNCGQAVLFNARALGI